MFRYGVWEWFWDDTPLGIITALILAGGIGTCCIGFVAERMVLPGELAEIETLRWAARDISVLESEDVMGQVAEMNRHIAIKQTYNQLWWSAWAIPNAWDNVEPIEILDRKGE